MNRASTWLKSGVGGLVSSGITLGLYTSAPVLWILWCLFPPSHTELLTDLASQRPVQYWETQALPEEEGAPEDAVIADGRVDVVGQKAPASGGGSPASAPAPDASALVARSGEVIVRTVDAPTQVRGESETTPEGGELSANEKAKRAMMAQRAAVMARGRKARCKKRHDDIAKTGDERFDVERDLVEYYTSNIKRFNSLGWSGPFNEDELRGWKISGFGCNSPLHFAGLRRGDVILSVNGKNMRTWIQVFGAYRKMKRQDNFDIVLVRRGEQHVLHYTLI